MATDPVESAREAERNRLKEFPEITTDDQPTISGILSADLIQEDARRHKLIEPFKLENLKPASYELTLGDEYCLGGKYRTLGEQTGSRELSIQPFEVAVLKTAETLNLPRFLIGRWNIRVTLAYDGLLWVGGPQVDPGWVGHLFCPIYNLSNNPVMLSLGDRIARIDFVKTTPVETDPEVKFQRPPDRLVIHDYKVDRLESALYVNARKRLDDVEEDLKSVRTRVDYFVTVVFSAFGLLVAALSILFAFKDELDLAAGSVLNFALGLSTASFALACVALKTSTKSAWATYVAILLLIVLFVVYQAGGIQ